MAALQLMAGCSLFGSANIPCESDAACPFELVCTDGKCRPPASLALPDAGVVPIVDAGPKVIPDAGVVEPEAGQLPDLVDAGPEDAGPPDAGVDAGPVLDAGIWHEPGAQLRRTVTLSSVSGDIPQGTFLRLRIPDDLSGDIRFYLRDGRLVPLETAVVGNQDESDTVLAIFRAPDDITAGRIVEGFIYHANDAQLSDDTDASLPDRRVVSIVANELNNGITEILPGNAQTPFVGVGSAALETPVRWEVEIGDDDITARAGVNTVVDAAFVGTGSGGDPLRTNRFFASVDDVVVVAFAVPSIDHNADDDESNSRKFDDRTVDPPSEDAIAICQVRTRNNKPFDIAGDNALRLTLTVDGTLHTFDAYALTGVISEYGLVVQDVNANSSVTLGGSRSAGLAVGQDTVEVKARFVLKKDIDLRRVDLQLVDRQAQGELPAFGGPPREGVVLVTGRVTYTHNEVSNTRISVSINANGDAIDSQANIALRDEQFEADRTFRTLGRIAPYRGTGAISVTVDVEDQGLMVIDDLVARALLLHEVATVVGGADEERPQ